MKCSSFLKCTLRSRPVAVLAIVFSFVGPLSSKAEAALVDLWIPKNLVVKPSFMVTADGTRIPIPVEQELLVQLRLDTAESYGSPATRLLKSKTVKDGVIQIEIETSSEKACRKNEGGMLAMMGPHSVDLKLALPPHDHLLMIDGELAGKLVVAETNSQYVPEPNYLADYRVRASNAFMSIVGAPSSIKIKGANGCEVGVDEENGKLVMSYYFPSRQETLRNGDILVKKERSGRVEIKNYDVRIDCEDKVVSHQVKLLGANRGRDGQIAFSVNPQAPGVLSELDFTTDELRCGN